MKYGCWNRAPYAPIVVIRAATATAPEISYPHRLAKDCRYTLSDLGKADAKCEGCVWKVVA